MKAKRENVLQSYVVHYNQMQWAWNKNLEHRIAIDQQFPQRTIYGYECTPDYLEWYIPRTHPFINPPSTDQYREVKLVIHCNLFTLVHTILTL